MTDRELLEMIALQVGGLTDQVGGLTGQVGGLTGQVGGLTDQVGELTGQVGKLTNRMDSLDTRMDSLDTRMDSLDTRMDGLTGQVGTLTNQVGSLTERVDGLQIEMQEGFREAYNERQEMKADITDIKQRVIKIEDEHSKKLSALFDGYKQNTEILERVESEVSKHEEIILRRVK